MRRRYGVQLSVVFMMIVLLLAGIGCGAGDGKIPITTSSEQALESFLQGRDLSEKLRAQDARHYFEKAVAEDPEFAMAYLYKAFTEPSAKGFFETLDKATALVEKVSKGERLWILGAQAGVNADPGKQREYYQQLVAAYPDDQRAHNLLGNHYFGQQDYELAIQEFNRAIETDSTFSQSYNQLGYSWRFLGTYDKAEKAFKKYIELIPNDPNPYDSYAELLMKMGKFDESIEYYRKALAIDPSFVASHIGIATNLNFNEKHADARKQLLLLHDGARNDGERRAAHFAMAVSYADEGDLKNALEELNKQHDLARKIDDLSAMAGDQVFMGNVLLEMGKADQAMNKFQNAVKLLEKSDLSEEVKENTRRTFLFNATRVAIEKRDFKKAKERAEEYRSQVQAINNPLQIQLAHQLAGMIALEEKDYEGAIVELQRANHQNPYNVFRLALAYQVTGEMAKARELCEKAAKFNALDSLNYAFIRRRASEMLATMEKT